MVSKECAKRLVLFDAHAIVHRAYHALPDFSTKDGEPTGGLYGLSTMLLRAIAEFEPEYMAACYDLPGATFRHKEYKGYKAGRAKADEELKQQLERSRNIFTAFHIPIYDRAGFEADDMLGTIVEQTKNEKNLEVLIVTGDMDTLQLVSGKRVRVYTLKKGINDTVVYDENAVFERFGFGPKFLPDYKGLRGDPSDNIIGVTGIGEKTGGELIKKFGTLEKLYATLKKGKAAFLDAGIKPRVIELLLQSEEEAFFSKMLATIRRDAPISFSLPDKTWKESFTTSAVITLFNQLEFKSLAVRVKNLLKQEVSETLKTKDTETNANGGESDVVYDPEELREAALGLWVLDSDKTTPGAEEIVDHTGERDLDKAKAKILTELKKEGLLRIYEEIELPLVPIIARAKQKGVCIDVAYLKKLSLDYHKKLAKTESAIYEYADEVFNINSPKQLGVVLFDKLLLTARGL
ncbi:MAG: 5'-3' exonuclease H3TH domain-containing protein, partial [Patescibacteria group bacterium]